MVYYFPLITFRQEFKNLKEDVRVREALRESIRARRFLGECLRALRALKRL